MRKVLALVAVLAIGGVTAAVAMAAQVNKYSVQGKVNPARSASKKHPLPIKLDFDFQVSEVSGNRPAPIKTYTIGFFGGADHGEAFPTCAASKINAAGNDSKCPKGSLVGGGVVKSFTGATSNEADKSIPCNLAMKLYNGGRHRLAIYLHGTPPDCAVSLSQAIDARFIKAFGGKGTALQFTVPDNLRHPLPGLDLAVVDTTSTINKVTTKYHGKKIGFLDAEQTCPKSRKVPMQVTFTTETGQKEVAKSTFSCRP